MSKTLLGVDTGGTFTDFVLLDAGRLRVHKVLSTPHAPEEAILQGLRELGLDRGDAALGMVHGSTVATNAVLEGKGVRTVYVTNRGLKDVLTIGRQARAALYDLQPALIPPPVPAALCLETGGRLGADGGVVEALTESDLRTLRDKVAALQPAAVAINLLFSYLDDRFERAIEAALPEGLFVSRSSAVLAEYREYERGVATWLNAWVGPLVQRYLARLQAALPHTRLAVMQSSGGTMSAAQAGGQAVHMLLSGPAGGLSGARAMAGCSGHQRLLSFDMGGTSTDVALIDGDLELTTEGRVGPYPVAVPMVDMHTIGAGGGSIAGVDAGGLLQVGPQSAGADPGPACYGRGGREPTVTDANLVLGRLRPDAFLGGALRLDTGAARQALARLAAGLGTDAEQAALGVVRVANEHMARALRVMSVQRGVDPRGLTLVSFGGAGGLHVCALAEELSMTTALVPLHAGVLSALGMLVAPRERQLSRTLNRALAECEGVDVEAAFAELAERGTAELVAEGVPAEQLAVERRLDLRYRGQSYCLGVPWSGLADSAQLFHDLHERRYGHQLDLPVELVTVRLALRGPAGSLPVNAVTASSAAPREHAVLFGHDAPVPVYTREALAAAAAQAGPLLVTDTVATTYVAPDWLASVDVCGNLLLHRGPAR
ncbi:MAG: hydantoinase [Gammaproteobacteria bacterium SG8_47]|nr:MAG: hydantoinase [Gammaproteobacteria bacterium SG8_47]